MLRMEHIQTKVCQLRKEFTECEGDWEGGHMLQKNTESYFSASLFSFTKLSF